MSAQEDNSTARKFGAVLVILLGVGAGAWVLNNQEATDAAVAMRSEPSVQGAVVQREPAVQNTQTVKVEPTVQAAPLPEIEAPAAPALDAAEVPAITPPAEEAAPSVDVALDAKPELPEATLDSPDLAATTAEVDPKLTDPALPRLVEIRMEGDGLTVLAGRATPFSQVTLFSNGAEVARADADASGSFATLAFLESTNDAQVMTVSQRDANGQETQSNEEVILAPIPARPVVAPEPTLTVKAEPTPPANGAPPEANVVTALDATQATETAPVVEAVQSELIAADVVGSQNLPRSAGQPSVPQSGGVDIAAGLGNNSTSPRSATHAESVQTASLSPPDGPQLPNTSEIATRPAQARPEVQQGDEAGRDVTGNDIDAVGVVPVAPSASTPAPETDRAAPSRLTILRSDADGVKLLASPNAPLPVAEQVALDTISYSQGGDVELQGRAQLSAGEVRVYLDNRAVAALKVDATGGWRGELPDVDTGVFTLRIDEVDPSGKVTSRVETPFKREDPEVLRAAAAVSEAPVKAITVQKGNTLWAIARDRYGEGIAYVQVFDANRDRIRDPDLIYPGQVIDLPSE